MGDEDRPKRPNGPQVLTGIRLTQQLLQGLHERHVLFVRGVRNGRRLVLRRCDLSGLDFTKMDLTGAELAACDFGGAKFRDAKLRLAQLFAANFDGANLTGANFEKADLRAAAFEHADLTGAKLQGADLRECAFINEKTNVLGEAVPSSFRAALLRGTNMANSKIGRASCRERV